ncbi:uncharacterized protein LOC105173740 [Olea europaea subsp. europaea]|uniref:Uncharacterized protein LOC105173740 n=1 Tax=Olea europaea subsp. europaea TaxID=158383 RepID=A0A8S0UL64_OLEEU|nr:uncharacterized protein LOC105173740 [Olea europaea subsp. europaea]
MEGGGAASVSAENASESAAAASYTYWIREVTHDAAPLPVPKKLNPEDLSNQSNKTFLGSAWNGAGTWEEKSLNKWATDRIKELLLSMGSLEFSGGQAEVSEVTKCSGDKKKVKGHIDVFEFSLGELDDLQIEVKLSEDKDLSNEEKQQIHKELKLFLQPLREKLLQFEQELRDR